MKFCVCLFAACLLWFSAPAQASSTTKPSSISAAQASAQLADLTRQLTTALLLQPHQVILLNRTAARELRLFTARRPGQPEAATPGSSPAPTVVSPFEHELRGFLTPFQLATFEQLKANTSLGELLQSPVFRR